jgi:hypothetical protein
MDPNTALTLLEGAVGGALATGHVVEKILGPTSEYLGEGLKTWTEKRMQNLGRIFEKGGKRLGDKLEQPGAVPPKVLRDILDHGSFADDVIAAEYFGGVLASSRSENSRDDRGASYTSLIGRLTTYQLRFHFYVYRVIKELFDGATLSVATAQGQKQLQVFIPFSTYVAAMEFSDQEDPNIIMVHTLHGLLREDLVGGFTSAGTVESLQQSFAAVPTSGLIIAPSGLGTELFLWAHGLGRLPLSAYLSPDIQFDSEIVLPTGVGCQPVHPEAQPTKD